MPVLVGPDVADRVGRGVGMAVGVTVEAGNALMSLQAAAVFGGVGAVLEETADLKN
jgi:hypothetical protein